MFKISTFLFLVASLIGCTPPCQKIIAEASEDGYAQVTAQAFRSGAVVIYYLKGESLRYLALVTDTEIADPDNKDMEVSGKCTLANGDVRYVVRGERELVAAPGQTQNN